MFSSLLILLLSSLSSIDATRFKLGIKPDFCYAYEQPGFLSALKVEGESSGRPKLDSHTNRTTSPSPSTPWTGKAECISDQNSNESFCVYTNQNFADGRGISFFTTPSIAEKVTTLAAFTQKGVHDNVNVFDNPPWKVVNVPGRGNGLFATRTLRRGDLILADTPLGVYNSEAFFPDYQIGYKYLRKTYEQLPEKSKQILLNTAAHSPGDPIMERINTNAFAGEFEGTSHFFLYPETALLNHDCRPNTMYYHNTSTLVHSAHASRTILPGEEITITYINLLQSRSERQDVLKMIWGFECTCSLCSKNSATSRRSDDNIQHITNLHMNLADWSSASTATPSMAESLLSLYKKEQIHAAIGTGHMFAALAYNAVGNIRMAVKHAKLAIEAGMVTSESSEDDTVQMMALLEDPKVHWSFKARSRRG
ncbi:SET protein [Venustampulla echinocandica]|uniref:SET protein n=1 Tax=Venustampulla echinocandica TaxID=2656787 RepID=A0A370TXQ2_9HELO|nr:SET protein [Venustampulla echinocandica]RDL40303.1 SET protein [Venustampulla echinocandica]